jgi:hypothetical protein
MIGYKINGKYWVASFQNQRWLKPSELFLFGATD